MCDLFITIISHLKILTFLNEKKISKKKKREKRIQCFKKMKQMSPPRALMEIYKSCELVFLSCKITTTFGPVTVADMIWN